MLCSSGVQRVFAGSVSFWQLSGGCYIRQSRAAFPLSSGSHQTHLLPAKLSVELMSIVDSLLGLVGAMSRTTASERQLDFGPTHTLRAATGRARQGGWDHQKFHGDPRHLLATYTCYHGDEEGDRTGSRLLDSAFLKGASTRLPNPLAGSRSLSLRTGSSRGLAADGATPTRQTAGSLLSAAGSSPLGASQRTFLYSAMAYTSRTGLEPKMPKLWLSEHMDEFRKPKDVRKSLADLTAHYGTRDALKTGRFQLHGYPEFKELIETSLTRRGQTAPTYRSNVTAY